MWFTKLSIGIKIALVIGLILALLFFQGIASFVGNAYLGNSSKELNHSYQMLEAVASVHGSLAGIQSDLRGYSLSGEKKFFSLYKENLVVLEGGRLRIRSLSNSNYHKQQMALLDRLIPDYLEWVRETFALLEKNGFDPARKLLVTQKGQDLMEQAHQPLNAMMGEEKASVMKLDRDFSAMGTALEAINLGAFVVSVLASPLLVYFLTRMITSRIAIIIAGARRIGDGEFAHRLPVAGKDELSLLGESFNQMASRLQQTSEILLQKEWLQRSLVKINNRLQGQRGLKEVGRIVLSSLAETLEVRHAVIYSQDSAEGGALAMIASYGTAMKNIAGLIKPGQGLVGQCALEGQRILLTEVPADYIKINSGLGEAKPVNIAVIPTIFNQRVNGVLEVAAFHRFTENHLALLDQIGESLGSILSWIVANARTDEILKQSQAQAEELLAQQNELKKTNTQMERQTIVLEERAEQLALASAYKSEFLANMSHELRTPLNSLLILSALLAENKEGNLSEKQAMSAQIIHEAGTDLLALINEILDMAKVESGTMTINLEDVTFKAVKEQVERIFCPIAGQKQLAFAIDLGVELPLSFQSDGKRLNQVLRNLLSNAFKFTEKGRVGLEISLATTGWSPDCESLNRAGQVVRFAVSDTGIGIPMEKFRVIFQPFQQGDTGTARRYGGSGLGLSISQSIARLLGGEIVVTSTVNQGSVFTLFLPLSHQENAS